MPPGKMGVIRWARCPSVGILLFRGPFGGCAARAWAAAGKGGLRFFTYPCGWPMISWRSLSLSVLVLGAVESLLLFVLMLILLLLLFVMSVLLLSLLSYYILSPLYCHYHRYHHNHNHHHYHYHYFTSVVRFSTITLHRCHQLHHHPRFYYYYYFVFFYLNRYQYHHHHHRPCHHHQSAVSSIDSNHH